MRVFILSAVFFCAMAGASPAAAQAESRARCDAIMSRALDPEGQPDADLLNAARVCQEAAKLREEVADLERNNRATEGSPLAGLSFLLPWSTLLTGVVGLILGVLVQGLGMRLNNTIKTRDEKQREQELFLKLLEGIGSGEKTRQLASTSALLRRYEDMAAHSKGLASVNMKTVQDVCVAILRDAKPEAGTPEGAFSKYLADSLVRSFGIQDASVRKPEPTVPATQREAPRPTTFSLAEQHVEGANLSEVFWAGVQAENVDFFQANLTGASLRDSWLRDAVFYDANLSRTVLRRSDLRGANFMMAKLTRADLRQAVMSGAKFDGADLSGARLQGADLSEATGLENARFDAQTVWNDATQWPDERRPGAGYDLAEGPTALTA